MLETYNTQREHIILREYGRNVQMIADHIKTLKDRDQKTKMAATLVELMKQVNPTIKDSQDFNQKVWDDLFIICGFDLDVDTPYPRPDASMVDKKPEHIGYNTNKLRWKHYGRNVELLIEAAIEKKDPEERKAAIVYIGKLMKRFYNTWNRDNPDDGIIVQNIKDISKGELVIDVEEVKAGGLFESKFKEADGQRANHHHGSDHRGGHDRKKKKFKKKR